MTAHGSATPDADDAVNLVVGSTLASLLGEATHTVSHRMVDAYAKAMGWTIHPVPEDGWCMLECVARATQRVTVAVPAAVRMALLRQTLEVIGTPAAVAAVTTAMGGAEAAEVLAMRAKLLGMSDAKLETAVKTAWDSSLWDVLPRWMVDVTGRPIVVIRANVRIAKVITDVVGGDTDPIRLVQRTTASGAEHYDLITGG